MTEFTLTTIKPSKTEAIRFKGKLIAETEWTTNAGEYMRFEIWETQGGAYIPVIEGSLRGDREVLTTADVIEPQDDRQQMHFAVLRFFDAHFRARSMIRDQLKWKMVREVA